MSSSLATLVLSLALGQAQAQPASEPQAAAPAAGPRAAERAAEAVIQKLMVGFNRGDIYAVAQAYDQDAVHMPAGPDLLIRGMNDVGRNYYLKMSILKEHRLELAEMRFHAAGGAVYATGLWRLSGTDATTGNKVRQAGRMNAVFAQREDRWYIVLDHWSVPVGAPPADR